MTGTVVDRGSMMADCLSGLTGCLPVSNRHHGTIPRTSSVWREKSDGSEGTLFSIHCPGNNRTLPYYPQKENPFVTEPIQKTPKRNLPTYSFITNHMFTPTVDITNAGLSTLPSLLRANQRNNPRQFSALRKLLLLGLLVNIVAGSDVIADLQHAVLKS
jgi:hypothetical protein